MNPLSALMLLGVAFFGFMVIVGIVKARRKKEKAYYISAVVSFLMLLWSVLIFLNQFILSLVPMVTWVILSIAGLPRITKVMRREPFQELQETDFSAPLKARESLTWKGWFKLASRWGVRRATCFYSLVMAVVSGAMLFTLSILGMISTAWAIGYTIIVGILSPIYFYRQVGKAMK